MRENIFWKISILRPRKDTASIFIFPAVTPSQHQAINCLLAHQPQTPHFTTNDFWTGLLNFCLFSTDIPPYLPLPKWWILLLYHSRKFMLLCCVQTQNYQKDNEFCHEEKLTNYSSVLLKFENQHVWPYMHNFNRKASGTRQVTLGAATAPATQFWRKHFYFWSISRMMTWLLPHLYLSGKSKYLALFFSLCCGVVNKQSHLLQPDISVRLLVLNTL